MGQALQITAAYVTVCSRLLRGHSIASRNHGQQHALSGEGEWLMIVSGPIFWAIVFVGGIVALGLALAYGISSNSKRTLAEKRVTEEATRDVYREEDRNGS
jgi:hypothetical protein